MLLSKYTTKIMSSSHKRRFNVSWAIQPSGSKSIRTTCLPTTKNLKFQTVLASLWELEIIIYPRSMAISGTD